MADAAREEAERFLSEKHHVTSHPEDREDEESDSNVQGEDEKNTSQKQHGNGESDPGTDDDDDDDDDDDVDTTAKMASSSAGAAARSRSHYRLPATVSHANTGPKGVITDARSYQRARREQLRQQQQQQGRINSTTATQHISSEKKKGPGSEEDEEDDEYDEDEDEDEQDPSDSAFMQTWRARRIQELSQGRHYSPTTRRVQTVDANGYLDAIENAAGGPDDVVVVLIYEVGSSWSRAVEQELDALASKYSSSSSSSATEHPQKRAPGRRGPRIRFVKLDQEIAQMEAVEVPALLAYRNGGDVFATLSGLQPGQPDKLERDLKRAGVLPGGV